MERRRSYFKQSVWNPDGMILDHIPWKKIFSNGVQQIMSNQKKFPVKLLRLALFAIGKCSQRKFPIKRFNHLLHLNIGGVYFAKTHYSSILMTTLLAAPYLIIISKDDESLIRYLIIFCSCLKMSEQLCICRSI